MNTKYTITIFVDGEEEYTFPLTPEEVISILGMKIVEAEEEDEDEDTPTQPRKACKKQTCKNCGKPGHRVSTCTEDKLEDEGEREPARTPKAGKLTAEQFRDVKEAEEHNMPAKDISANLGVSLREINRAFQSSSYDGYLSIN